MTYYDPSGFSKTYTVDEIVAVLQTDSNGNKYILNKDHDTAYRTHTLSTDDYKGVLQSHHGLQKDKLNQKSAVKIEKGDLEKLTYSREDI